MVLLSLLVLLIIGSVIPFTKYQTYGSQLEEYIVKRYPKDTYDIDRLTKEFESKQQQGIV